jgi:DNA-binding transcriptional LysR family regulator
MPDNIEISQLRMFSATARSQSMTAAAAELGVTQSAISQALKQLEKTFGMALLDREHRPLKLTGPGLQLLSRVMPILDATDNLVTDVREQASRPALQLRLGCIDSLLASIGPGLVRDLRDRVQRLTVTSGTTNVQCRALLEREIDIALCSDPLEGSDGILSRPIFTEPFVLLVPASMAAQPPTCIQDLLALSEQLPLIRFNPLSHMGVMTDLHLRRLGLQAPRVIELDSSEAQTAMVAGELGWAITTPLCLHEGRTENRPIRVLPLPGLGFSRTLYVMARAGEFATLQNTICRIVATILREECLPRLAGYAPWAASNITILEG